MSKWSRLVNLWRGRSLDAEFDEELQFHFDMRVDANVRAGMTLSDAEREAHRHLGRTLHVKEGMRDARVMTWLEALARDLRHGARMFLRQPGTTALAVLTLSLGIGANAVIFSLLHAVLLRPLPFPDADRLVTLSDHFRSQGPGATSPTVPEILDVRAGTQLLDAVSFYDMRDVQVGGGTEPARAFAARVEASFLTILGVRPAVGRLFVDGENTPGRDRLVILSDGFWRRNFGGDRGIIGRQIIVNAVPTTVVGVLPAGFHFDYLSAEPIELFVPFTMRDTYTSRSGAFANVRRVFAIGRLKPGVTLAQASSELESISQSLATEHPTLYRRGSDGRELGFVMSAEPLRIAVAGAAPRILLLLSAAVGLVLLIACVNTAHFLLARAIERQQEVAVRSALGASRGRLVRQFLSEAALLAVTAAAAGLLQAAWLLDIVNASLSSRATIAGAVGMNAAVMTFTAGLALGMAAAVAASGALRALLRGLTHLDAATVAAIGAFYLLVVAVAVCIPAVRALRLDPAAVLRSE